jgi:hypothetical protein
MRKAFIMGVRVKDMNSTRHLPPIEAGWQRIAGAATVHGRGLSFLRLVTIVLVVWASYLLIDATVTQAQRLFGSIHYTERPMTQLAGFVGHNETSGMPSYFLGINMDRQVTVVQFPGGDTTKARVLEGPYLFGEDGAQAMVNLGLEDINQDGHVDLLVTVSNEQVVYLNKNGEFRLPTVEEQGHIRSLVSH